MRGLIALSIVPLAAGCVGAHRESDHLARRVIAQKCAMCHSVAGVVEARGTVGPSLDGVGIQQVIAGRIPNTKPNMIRWITHAQSISPGNVMPDIPMTHAEAEAVADYLYLLD